MLKSSKRYMQCHPCMHIPTMVGMIGLMLISTFVLAGMEQATETTEKKRSVVVQKTKICNYGQARYELANALTGVAGYELTEDFKNAIRLLPSAYSVNQYTRFLDDWGTVGFSMDYSTTMCVDSCILGTCFFLFTKLSVLSLAAHS